MKNRILSLILAVTGLFGLAQAADLTTPQMQALKALAQSDQTANGYLVNGNDNELASWFNALNTKIVWKSTLLCDEIFQSDGFDWTRVDNLSAGKDRIQSLMCSNVNRSINPSKANVRAGIDAVWVGTTADLAVRAVIYALAKRTATRAEAALATGTGTTASPATLGWEGQIDQYQVSAIRSQ